MTTLVSFWDHCAWIYDTLDHFWPSSSLVTARNRIYLSHLQIYLSHLQFISVMCITEKNWKWLKITVSESQWYMGGLGSLRIVYEHFEITLKSICINLWYVWAVLSHFMSCDEHDWDKLKMTEINLKMTEINSIACSDKTRTCPKLRISIIKRYKVIAKWFQNVQKWS